MGSGGTLGRLLILSVRCTSVAVGLVLVALIAPTPAACARGREPQMRVLLLEDTQLSLRSDGAKPLLVQGLPGGERQPQRLQLSLQGRRLSATVDGRSMALGSSTLLTVQNDDPRGIWLGSRRYRGVLRISGRGGSLRVVNSLGIETYLASVVGSEMPHRWPLAALQAQAVAARTYALKQRSRGGAWDVKATVASQVYRGVESETPSTRQAVASTRSLVLVHGGRLIDAVFHSSSGGVTEASGMVWRRQHPYLVSVPDHDQHSPVHRWEQWFDPAGLRQRLPETGGLEAVEVLSRSDSGRVRQARLRGPRGSLVLSGGELRKRLGLKSTLVSFEMVSGAQRPPVDLPVGSVTTPASNASRISRITASVARQKPRWRPLLVAPPPLLVSKTSIRRWSAGGLQLLVKGQGYGHGVGMSQWGAHGLAEQGADFRAILQHYYRGAELMPYRPHFDPSLALKPPIKPLWKETPVLPFGTVSLSSAASFQ
ncbi:SpoIID/LytB domain-containing protein [Synechococcus sp. KORDI-52]|uniref:SpoIID/LytB domain-containing protein n=1 Tax=Synechococcus sp. KORDI-52 TaxID=585425 RepID=UPI000B1889CA|nr:SpoIID/LytB domain-containing protein [Synechococcus sp. KORDI-52]